MESVKCAARVRSETVFQEALESVVATNKD